MARKILWASLALVPVVLIAEFVLHVGDVLLFVLAAVALIPLAWLIGEATEHAAHHTGAGVGGFLNATFGNAPELIIALFAVAEMKFEVVRGSLTGSVVGNLLLVLGFSLLFGGRGAIDRESSFTSLALIVVAVLVFLIPSVPSWDGDPERHNLALLTIPVSIVLLLLYLVVTWIALRRHRELHLMEEPSDMQAWSLRVALAVLAVATVATALVAEALVGSLETFADKAGPDRVLRRGGDRGDRRQRSRARGRRRRRLSGQDQARRGDRIGVERTGCRLPDSGGCAARVADRAAGALLPAGRDRRRRRARYSSTAALLAQGQSSRARGIALIAMYIVAAAAFFIAGDR